MIDDVTAAILLDIESPFWRQWAADTVELLAGQGYVAHFEAALRDADLKVSTDDDSV